MSTRTAPPQRLLFFDNLRYVVIIWVVLFHVSAGLCGYPEFIQDADSSILFAGFNGYSLLVMMTTLFFIAGYFAGPALRGHGTTGFLRRKLRRLGIPWLVGVLLLGPIMPYMSYYSRSFAGLSSASYGEFWLTYVGHGLRNWFQPIAFTANTHFHHQHFWFLSDLLLFFATYALLRAVWRHWSRGRALLARHVQRIPPTDDDALQAAAPQHVTRAFLAVAVIAGVGMGTCFALDLSGGVYGFFLVLQPGLFLFGSVFALGLYAETHGWYRNGQGPDWKTARALAVGLLLSGATAATLFSLQGPRLALMPAVLLAVVHLTLLSLLGLIAAARRWMNRSSRRHARLAASSYGVYLVQYPVILAVHLLVFTWETSPYLKFVVIALPALWISYALSHYLVRPRPRLAVAAALVLNLVLCVTGLPRTAWSHVLMDQRPAFAAVIPPGAELTPLLPDGAPTHLLDRHRAGIAWRNGRLYHAGKVLRVRDTAGQWHTSSLELASPSLALLADGRLAAIHEGRIITLTDLGDIEATLSSLDSCGSPGGLVADPMGGLYFGCGDTLGIRQLRAGEILRYPKMDLGDAGALATDGARLFWSARTAPWIHVMDVDSSGTPGSAAAWAEVFLADGRYGRRRHKAVPPDVTALVSDTQGRLLLVNRVGLLIYDAQGALLGVMPLPHGVSAATFGGEDLSTLYLASPTQVYALRTLTTGAGSI